LGSGVLGGGVVAGAVSPVLFVPFEEAGSRVDVCWRWSVLSSVPPEHPTRPSVATAATTVREASRLNETLMYQLCLSKRRTAGATAAGPRVRPAFPRQALVLEQAWSVGA